MIFKIFDPSLATLGPKTLRVKQGKPCVSVHSSLLGLTGNGWGPSNDIYDNENKNNYCWLNIGSVQAPCWVHTVSLSPKKDHFCPFSRQERMKYREILVFGRSQRKWWNQNTVQGKGKRTQSLCSAWPHALFWGDIWDFFGGGRAQPLIGGVMDAGIKDFSGFVWSTPSFSTQSCD